LKIFNLKKREFTQRVVYHWDTGYHIFFHAKIIKKIYTWFGQNMRKITVKE